MKTCIIIDDEIKARQTLEKMIQRFYPKRMKVVGMADSVKGGVKLINENQPDVVFLDVEMPEENGLQLFTYFRQPNFDVIFTTAYQKYAISAFKNSAVDFILKPFNQIDLGEAITKLENKDNVNKNTSLRIENLLHNLNIETEEFSKIVLPKTDGFEFVKTRNIIFCKANKNYCEVNTVSNETIIVSKPLRYVEELLPQSIFFRTHKSYLININYIKSVIRTDGGQVILENGKNIPIASTHFKKLMDLVTSQS